MKKFAKFGVLVLIAALVCVALPAQAQDGTTTTYNRIDEGTDWGFVTTMLIVDLQAEVAQGSVYPDTFSVYAERSDARLEEPLLEEGEMTVVEAYVSDGSGNPLQNGNFATLIMEIGPTISISAALNYGPSVENPERMFNDWTQNVYTITQEKAIGDIEGLVATEMNEYTRVLVDDFEIGKASYEDEEFGLIELPYAYYAPADDEVHPLIVWLHGGGEGGSDATIPLSANKAATFASEETQAIFGGAYVLVPQAPTMWLEDGTEDGSMFTILSKYTRSVQDLVESYVAENPNIDTNRIYVGGPSNGGFLTVRMVVDYPDYYAAAIPVCEVFDDDILTDEELEAYVDMPIWFVTSATDMVLAHEYAVQMYDRLRALGSEEVYISFLPRVIDETGLYANEDGSDYEYNGHWSWIYVYNNHLAQIIDGENVVGRLYGKIVENSAEMSENIDGDVVTILEWWAAQSK